jgi:hypothetical protein
MPLQARFKVAPAAFYLGCPTPNACLILEIKVQRIFSMSTNEALPVNFIDIRCQSKAISALSRVS